MADKTPITGKVKKDGKKFKIKKADYKNKDKKNNEIEIDVEVDDNGTYDVEKLSTEELPEKMSDGTSIRWFNNFYIKENGNYIKKKYTVTVPGLSNRGSSKLVVMGSDGVPQYYTGTISGDSFELTDGDPAVGGAP